MDERLIDECLLRLTIAAARGSDEMSGYKRDAAEMLKSDKKNAGLWYFMGNIYYIGGEYGRAEECFRMSVKFDPSARNLAGLAFALRQLGKNAESDELIFEKIPEARPG